MNKAEKVYREMEEAGHSCTYINGYRVWKSKPSHILFNETKLNKLIKWLNDVINRVNP